MLYKVLKKVYREILKRKQQRYIDSLIQKGLCLGENVEIIGDFFFDPSHCFLISIGDNCTICPNVRLIAHDASTKKILGYTKIGRIDIMENCFIGDSTIILPKVRIGANAIIGAGSIVKHSIPPDVVAAGTPAKVICTVKEYVTNIKMISKDKKIFNEDYYIQNIDDSKRDEIIQSIGESIGFIV